MSLSFYASRYPASGNGRYYTHYGNDFLAVGMVLIFLRVSKYELALLSGTLRTNVTGFVFFARGFTLSPAGIATPDNSGRHYFDLHSSQGFRFNQSYVCTEVRHPGLLHYSAFAPGRSIPV